MNASDQQLKEIADLAATQLRLEREIADFESKIEERKTQLNKVSMSLIPEAMMAVGMESFKMADGSVVKVEKFYSGKITEDKEGEAFAWLRKSGNDSLIKREVKCLFGKGEDNDAGIVVQALRDLGHDPIDKQSVHPMTLKSFIREQFEAGSDFPSDLFGAYVGNKTKITPSKK